MKKLMAVVLAVLVVGVLGGCTSYGGMYQAYLESCNNPANQRTMEIPVGGGGGTVRINQGCNLQAPVDSDAKWVGLAGTVISGGLNAAVGVVQSNNNKDVQIQANKSNEIIFTNAFDAVGNRIDAGGDVNFTGNDGSAGDVTTTNPPPASTGSSGSGGSGGDSGSGGGG